MNVPEESPGPVVVLGSRPGLVLPDVGAPQVIAANAAIELAPYYRERHASHVTAVIASTGLRKDERLRAALTRIQPDEVIVPGSKLADPYGVMHGELGLDPSSTRVLARDAGFHLMRRRIGWKAYWAASRRYRFYTPELGRLLRFACRVVARRPLSWEAASSGVTAVLIALERSEPDGLVIVSGIGLQKGGHFHGEGSFGRGRARVDRAVISALPERDRRRLRTTDPDFARRGGVGLFDGPTVDPARLV